MNLVQRSRSLSDFLSSPGIYANTSQLKGLTGKDTSFPIGNHANKMDLFIPATRVLLCRSWQGEDADFAQCTESTLVVRVFLTKRSPTALGTRFYGSNERKCLKRALHFIFFI